jgi:hypothetical protein
MVYLIVLNLAGINVQVDDEVKRKQLMICWWNVNVKVIERQVLVWRLVVGGKCRS